MFPNEEGSVVPQTPRLATRGAAPVDDVGRMISLDLLRGFAVLGILSMNIVTFATIFSAYQNPTALGPPSESDYRIWYVFHLFADLKFMSIFSMLFGAGVVLMTSRAEERTGGSAAVHYRRMGWLILFGLLHAHLLWYGDILYMYGICGLLLWILRKLHPLVLVALALPALLIPVGFMLLSGWLMQGMTEEQLAQQASFWAPSAEAIQEQFDTYRGGWLEQASHRSFFAVYMQTMGLIFFGSRAGGMMLLGMALYKWGVLSATKSRAFYSAMFLIGMGVGLPVIMYGVRRYEASNWSFEYQNSGVGMLYNYFGSVAVALGWVALIMLVAKSDVTKLFRPLAAAGQMALTNYLMQTIICTTIFYGHGFGQFGHFSRAEMLMTVVCVWIFQLIVSPIWLHYFRFGPFEWLWRSLTYCKPQPILRRASAGIS